MTNVMGTFGFFLITLSASCYGSDAGAISFDFPPQTDIRVSADAFISNDAIQLTMSESSLGWATYSNIIPSQALTSFSTHFQFSMATVNGSGDGLTFFLAPSDLQSSEADHGKWLGLFQSETDGNSSNQILAVEFDTYKDEFDPDDNHVGIDVNSIKSVRTVSVSNLFTDAVLKDGSKWDAWVEYYGPVAQVQVFLSQNPSGVIPSRPEKPILLYDIDLSQFLPPVVKVGISASTGVETETHTVYAWSFSCQDLSGALTLTPAPIRKKKHHNFLIISIVIIIAITMAIMLVTWWRRSTSGGMGKKTEKKPKRASLELVSVRDLESGEEESYDELDKRLARAIQSARKFSYDELRAATKNFSPDEEIGVGGFGKVYRGTLPDTSQAVAVKRMDQDSNQDRQKVYESEVIINGNLTHRNLVKFLGWCHRKEERLLVYELLPNGSLDKYIFQDHPSGPLEWDKRYMIVCDVAAALVYLHQDRRDSILHRDIKPHNVMLDSDFRAKLGDFGLARALGSEEEEHCHNSTQYGTHGYVAPEYATDVKFSRESDVFSFGALALAVACGKQPIDTSLVEHNSRLVEWVWDLHGKNSILDAADEKLDGNSNDSNDEQIERLLLVGLCCSHPDPDDRLTMKKVLNVLERGDKLAPISRNYPRAPRLPIEVSSSSGTSGGFSSRV